MKPKILCLCDSPTDFTGFAEVGRNLFKRWADGFEIHVWAIGFNGAGYEKFPNLRLIPAQPDVRKPWHLQLGAFLTQLNDGGYTHVWLLNDANVFAATDFPNKFRQVCALKKIRSMLYFPVDSALEADWCGIINMVDVAVTYTEYAAGEVRKAGCRAPLHVLPHGVDAEFFTPQPHRKNLLKELVVKPTKNSSRQFATDQDFVIVNVNKNEWRKDLFRSFQILAGLRERGVPAKLLLRTAPRSGMAGIDLEMAGAALGLKVDEHWTHLPPITAEGLVQLYNAADLNLTTTLGEGWGLNITEALACGCAVAAPGHTACFEIMRGSVQTGTDNTMFVPLPYDADPVFGPVDARLRHRVNLQQAVQKIHDYYESKLWVERPTLAPETKEWLSWDRIAMEMLKLLVGNKD